ncbi:uncharacterized protein LOC128958478 [Oppia nitens]|uniref:uncharacterized protein LOC128958478 n=1 Tax=Oppia nitens TaxID=1686743 RepID=UPI0023DC2280|nr:uncharacterized protein LOC128958478 [Oppia nitens]
MIFVAILCIVLLVSSPVLGQGALSGLALGQQNYPNYQNGYNPGAYYPGNQQDDQSAQACLTRVYNVINTCMANIRYRITSYPNNNTNDMKQTCCRYWAEIDCKLQAARSCNTNEYQAVNNYLQRQIQSYNSYLCRNYPYYSRQC